MVRTRLLAATLCALAGPQALAQDAPSGQGPTVAVHGGAYLWFAFPVLGGNEQILDSHATFDLYAALLTVDASLAGFDFHAEPRVRITKLREYYPSNVWVEEIYLARSWEYGTARVGKTYSAFGHPWDDSFWGNIPCFDGLALDPNFGASFAGERKAAGSFTLNYAAQYFVVDAQENYSLMLRDTVSVPGGRKRNMAVVRVEPGWRFSEAVSASLGLSGQYFLADLASAGAHDVWRAAADASLNAGPVTAFFQYARQEGQSVTQFPIAAIPAGPGGPGTPAQVSAHNDYVWAGAEVKIGRFVPRYNFSLVKYRDAGVSEWIHAPGITVAVNDYVSVIGEFIVWPRDRAGATALLDESLNLILYVHL